MIAGDVLEITFNNEDVGSGVLFCKANEDSTFQLGGIVSEDDEDMIATNGQIIDKMTRKRSGFECTLAWEQNAGNTLKTLLDLQKSLKLTTFTIAHISGAIYQMEGKPVGVHAGNGNQATIPLKLQGSEMTQQA